MGLYRQRKIKTKTNESPNQTLPKLPTKFTKRSVLCLWISVYDLLSFLIPVIMKGCAFSENMEITAPFDRSMEKLVVRHSQFMQQFHSPLLQVHNFKNVQLHVFTNASYEHMPASNNGVSLATTTA